MTASRNIFIFAALCAGTMTATCAVAIESRRQEILQYHRLTSSGALIGKTIAEARRMLPNECVIRDDSHRAGVFHVFYDASWAVIFEIDEHGIIKHMQTYDVDTQV